MVSESIQKPVVLTISGFDPSGGAGVIADVSALIACGCRPVAAITSLTFQNAQGVFGSLHQSAEAVRAQILPLVDDFKISAVKVGMLPTEDLVREVVRLLDQLALPAPTVDPVLRSTSGHELMTAPAIDAWLAELMPRARLITPNIPEAERLTGSRILSEVEMLQAAAVLRQRGAQSVLIKGGHLEDKAPEVRTSGQEGAGEAIDVLNEKGNETVFRGEWIAAPPVRGTGCRLASSIAAGLSQGMSLTEAVSYGKQFVARVIRAAAGQIAG